MGPRTGRGYNRADDFAGLVNDFDDNKAEAAVPTVAQTAPSRYYGSGNVIWSHFLHKTAAHVSGKC